MPTYFARSNGNVNAAIWATTPGGTAASATFVSGDVLVANSFTVTLNVSTDLGSTGEVRNDTTGGATAGGSFSLSNGVTLTANVFAGSTSTACISVSGTASASVVGNITGGTGSSAVGVSFNSTGTFSVTGSITGGSGSNSSGLVMGANSFTLTVTGNISGGSGGVGLVVQASGTLTVTGNVTGSTAVGVTIATVAVTATFTGTITGAAASGLTNAGSGSTAISGTVVGGVSAGGVFTGSGSATITRARGGALASSAVGVSASASGSVAVESIEYGDLGASPTSGPIRLTDNSSNVAVMYRFNTTKKTLVDTASTALLPAASNVRSGVTYNAGQTTGTCAVPGASSVLVGVPVDNTVGTASVSSTAIQSACDAAIAAFSSGRLANVATVASTGQQIANAFGS
jgi:hypothetical protein